MIFSCWRVYVCVSKYPSPRLLFLPTLARRCPSYCCGRWCCGCPLLGVCGVWSGFFFSLRSVLANGRLRYMAGDEAL